MRRFNILMTAAAAMLIAAAGAAPIADARPQGGGGHGGGGAGFSGGHGGGGFGGGRGPGVSGFRGGGPSMGVPRASPRMGHGPRGAFRAYRGRSHAMPGSGPRSFGHRGGRHHGHHGHRHRHGKRVIIGTAPFWPYYYDDYGYDYSDDECGWLYRRAVRTGSAYWWDRYHDCID